MVHTVISFFGIINVGDAHCDDDCLFITPMDTNMLISFIRVALCSCGIGYGLPWYGLAPSFNSIDKGGRFQSPRVQSKSISYLSSNESSFSQCDGFRWEKLSLTMAGKSALLCLVSNISITFIVACWVQIGSWARQVFCLNALVTLGLSCRWTIFLFGRRILSIVMFFFEIQNCAYVMQALLAND